MNIFGRWFSKTPEALLAKGDKYMESDCFFDARTCYEDGLDLCSRGDHAGDPSVFSERIAVANLKLAERNLNEAEFAYSRGDQSKAKDHLELVKTLTYDVVLREKAESMLKELLHANRERKAPVKASSCSSCSGSSVSDCSEVVNPHDSLSLSEYYELLIQQLPVDQSQRYSELGEEFACAYVAASRDENHEALSLYEKCRSLIPADIYWCETGKVLHRLGNDRDAERHLRMAVQVNAAYSVALFSLAHLLQEYGRFHDALAVVDVMSEKAILPEQATLLRSDILYASGEHEGAIVQCAGLLQTPYARAAAEKLYVMLSEVGRQSDADAVFKKYLSKSCK